MDVFKKITWRTKFLGILAVPFIILLSYYVVMAVMPLTEAQQQTWDYLQGDQVALPYTEMEQSHLEDVKQVMRWIGVSFMVLALLVLLISLRYRNDKALLQKWAQWSGIYTAAFTTLILVVLVLGFETIFTLFHQIFFPQGNWQFAANSVLIITFPQEFFVQTAILIFGVSLLFAILCVKYGKSGRMLQFF